MNKDDQMLSAELRDKLRQCERRGMPTHCGFLAPAEVNFAESFCIAQKALFRLDGGYEDAERRICIFLPESDVGGHYAGYRSTGNGTDGEDDTAGPPLPEDDPKQRKPIIDLARKELGWEPAVMLREGLEKTIEYFDRVL